MKDSSYPYDGGWRALSCQNLPTHTGLDLPNGRYRITSKAQTPTGPITHVEEVSFP